MTTKLRLLAAWAVGTITMIVLSSYWHLEVLNDVSLFKYSLSTIQVFSWTLYAILCAVLVFLASKRKRYKLRTVTALRYGLAAGTAFFLIILSGFPFGPQKEFHLLLMDLVWQWMEQTTGALAIIAIFKVTTWKRKPREVILQ